jgi:hypothetical protein
MSEHVASRPDVELVPEVALMPSVELGVDTLAGDDPDLRLDLFDPRIEHRVHLMDRGPFAVAVCRGCGWESFARRSRPLARSEGRDHAVLFTGAVR